MKFFDKADKKTIAQGMLAWFIYQIFFLIDDQLPEKENNFIDILMKLFIVRVAIPTISIIGFEDIIRRINNTPLDINLAMHNLISVVLTASLTYSSTPSLEPQYTIPCALYGLAFFHHLVPEPEEEALDATPSEELLIHYPRRLSDS